MKKIFTTIASLLLVMGTLFIFTACDKSNENKKEAPVFFVPANQEEFIQEINDIYGANSIDPQEVTSVHTLAILTSISQTLQADPISVTPATLNGEEITLVTIGGTELKDGQATGIKESALGSMGKNNDYLQNVIKLFDDDIVPKDKPILVTGISLGGIIAQQILDTRYSDIINEYDIKGIVCFGAPFTPPLVTKGTDRNTDGVKIVRFTDSNDMVPKSVVSDGTTQGDIMEGYIQKHYIKTEADMRLMRERNEREIVLETGLVKDGLGAHALSYIGDPCWDKYDFLGDKAGTNKLVLQEKMTFYPAPTLK